MKRRAVVLGLGAMLVGLVVGCSTGTEEQDSEATARSGSAVTAPCDDPTETRGEGIMNLEFSGAGYVDVIVFRKGIAIAKKTIPAGSELDVLSLGELRKGDSISVTGRTDGRLQLTLNVATIPALPEIFTTQLILGGYLIR